MYARLAFSVAINIDPDLLIVDEALSVGDMGFQHKCMNKMKELIEKGVTVLFVSHDTFAVKSLCSRCIYLEEGKVKADGNAIEVTDLYLMDTRKKIYSVEAEGIAMINHLASQSIDKIETDGFDENIKDIPEQATSSNKYENLRYGTGAVRIKNVVIRNESGIESDHFGFAEIMNIEIELQSFEQIEKLNCCIRIRDKNGIDVTGTTTYEENIRFPIINKMDRIKINFIAPNLFKHDMSFSLGVTINNTENIADQTILDHVDLAYTFKSVYDPQRPVWYMFYQNYDIRYDIFQGDNENGNI
jgi:ABC-type Fe3+/spermidine/putrescine transport system ATPase subunit